MNLHEDNEAFSEFVQLAAETFGLPQVYVEKDYWVTKSLKYLSESVHVDDVVFKGEFIAYVWSCALSYNVMRMVRLGYG